MLLSVTVCAVDLLATTWVKLRLAGETSAFGLRATPLPESAAVELPALWTMLKLPFTVPALAGLKAILEGAKLVNGKHTATTIRKVEKLLEQA